MITIIAAVGNNNELGKGADLLWHLPNDFKHFKALTTGHCIIMGRKTFETFKKPLPNRKHIVDYKKWKLVEVEHFKADEKHAYDYSIEYLVLND